jgi:hypothetical protein
MEGDPAQVIYRRGSCRRLAVKGKPLPVIDEGSRHHIGQGGQPRPGGCTTLNEASRIPNFGNGPRKGLPQAEFGHLHSDRLALRQRNSSIMVRKPDSPL